MFWDDTPPPKVVKEKPKREPPQRVWERPDYLPYLNEAMELDRCTLDVQAALVAGITLLFDVEVYPNYFLVTFTSAADGSFVWFELDEHNALDIAGILWLLQRFEVCGFNSVHFDMPILSIACAGAPLQVIQWAVEEIILRGTRSDVVLHSLKCKALKANHIDLFDVAPLRASLKAYGARLHSRRVQDLPFAPGTVLSTEQKRIVRLYNVLADLETTRLMFNELKQEIDLRRAMTEQYGVDLRSKSDAQIAEAVISAEMKRLTGDRPKRPDIQPGYFFYQPPAFLQYTTPMMQEVLQTAANARFDIGIDGQVGLPEAIKNLKPCINQTSYQMGNGGLHSDETSRYWIQDAQWRIFDRDVTSYYPNLILGSRMFPPQLGQAFLYIYQSIVDRRIKAKADGNKVVANTLKITANGTFGKLGSPYSILYAPHLLIQVTLTGQLALLMLIERLELAGICVVSANTDGIVIHCHVSQEQTYRDIVAQWERDTALQTEESVYSSYYARDVNNYIAIKQDGEIKTKGTFNNPWADPAQAIFRFHKNPQTTICIEAVVEFLKHGTPLMTTMQACNDVRKFVAVRSVRGGGVKVDDAGTIDYLGKTVRWYYAAGETGCIVYASNGNMVPKSEGAKGLMQLPDALPEDVDLAWYEQEARTMLKTLGLPEDIYKGA